MPSRSYSPIHNQRFALLCLGLIIATIAVAIFDLNPWATEAAVHQPATAINKPKKKRPDSVPGEILVRFRETSEVARTTSRVGAKTSISLAAVQKTIPLQVERLDKNIEIVRGLRLARVSPDKTDEALAALNSRSDVVYAEPNYIRVKQVVPNDPRFVD